MSDPAPTVTAQAKATTRAFLASSNRSDDKTGSETGYGVPTREAHEAAIKVTTNGSRMKAFLAEGARAFGNQIPTAADTEPCPAVKASCFKQPYRAYIVHGSADNDRFPVREEDEPVFTILSNNHNSPRAFVLSDEGTRVTIREEDEPFHTITVAGAQHPVRAYLIGGSNTSDEQAAPGVGVSDAGEPSRCVTAQPSSWRAHVLASRVVRMTPRALARFQSFPDDYILPEKTALAYKVIGNAVPPLLFRCVVEAQDKEPTGQRRLFG